MSQTEIEWSRMTAAEVNALAEQDAILLIPVASTEQHGPHLATGCDTILCGEVARRTARLVAEKRPILVAPTVWIGLASHHLAIGGTFSVTFDTYAKLLGDIAQSAKTAGFSKLLFINGHGGNIAALSILSEQLARETGLRVAVTTYARLATEAGDFAEILEDQDAMHHACEAETSMLLALDQGFVRKERLPDAHQDGFKKGDPSPAGGALSTWTPFNEFTASGVRGDARRASAEKGEKLFAACANRLAEKLIAGEPWARVSQS